MATAWSIERGGPVSSVLRIPFQRSKDWEQWGLLTADRHIDNPKSDLTLQRHHLNQARDRGAFILDFGDFQDAMQGKSDKRSSKEDLLARFVALDIDPMEPGASKKYLNALTKFGAEFWEPYLDELAILAKGNHETGIEKHQEYDLLDGVLTLLHYKGGEHIINGGYRGWIRFQFEDPAGARFSRKGYYHHGYGGGGQVTKDIIQASRKAVYLSNADYVFSGHTHDQWWFPIARVRLNEKHQEVKEIQHHVKIPSYKEEFVDQSGGFAHEKGHPPKPTGAWWMRFYWSPRTTKIETQFIPAES